MSNERNKSPRGTEPPKPIKREEGQRSPPSSPTPHFKRDEGSPSPRSDVVPILERGVGGGPTPSLGLVIQKRPPPESRSREVVGPMAATDGGVIERKEFDLRVLWVLDAYGWAYDVGCDGLYKELGQTRPDWLLAKCLYSDVRDGSVNPAEYDVVFVWCWCRMRGSRPQFYPGVIDNLDPAKSIIAIASEGVLGQLKTIRKELRSFRYMAANNRKMCDVIRELSPYKTVFELEYGVDLERFRPRPFPEDFKVGWAGHKGRGLKRHWMAEEACEMLGVPLVTAGHVSSKNYIPHKRMGRFYGDVSCLLITSESEAHPLVYYEALASGRPTVSTLVGDIPETAIEGVNGFYLPVDCSVRQIASRLRWLRDDPRLLARMGENARRIAEEKWSWRTVSEKYLRAVDEVTGKFSACMLVSRDNKPMRRAVEAVVRQKPAEFRAYIDPVMLPDQRRARRILRAAGAKVFEQNVTDAEDHHEDVVESVHRAILEAEHRVVMWADDDDEIIGDVAGLVSLVGDGIGIVYGNVRQRFESGYERVRHGEDIEDPIQMPRMKGSTVLYNRDAFRRIHGNIDHGYFWDYKIGAWMLRAGYKLRYFNQTLSIQNVNPSPSKRRKSLYDAWPSMVEEMDKQPLRLAS